jgi:signal transduction histidine kinase/ActR/RegA family two-component response regulator
MKSVPLRRRLFALALAGVLPLAIMSGIGLYALARQQRVQAERAGLELARAVASSVEAELRSAVQVLETLAITPSLDTGDLTGFRQRADRIVAAHPQWAAIMLADPSGVRLVDTRYPAAANLPPIAEPASFARVVESRRPVVGGLARGPQDVLLYRVRVPVLRGGELRFVLTALVKPEEIRDVLTRQRVPGDWVISVFDSRGLRVARSRAHEENLGGLASPSLRELMASGAPEGAGVTETLEGGRIYTAYSRLERSGWSAALGIPVTLVESAVYRSVAVYGAGVVLTIVLGTLATLWVARSITRPIAGLRSAAQALGRREEPRPPDTSVQEIRDVAAALTVAAAERAQGEAEREELLRKERQARETAEAADRAKDEFLALLSHELRTPLNAVYGWARMLRDGGMREEATERALDAIIRNANAQLQLIDDLLDVSRVISGKMRLDVRSVDLGAVIEAALDAVRPAAEANAIRLQTVLDPRAGPVSGDPGRLQQVVWNLLINAVKFTPRQGRVQIHLQRVNSHVEIVVSDTGQGIAPDILPFVFDRFRQADSSSTRAHGGLGLGLSLVKHLVELHGGSVLAQSSGEGKGATFVVKLPLAIADIPAGRIPRVHPTADSAGALPSGTRLDGLRVLIVDDDPGVIDLTTAIVAGAGATVRTSRSASEAFVILREWRPDVLVSDIEMPDEDGYALIRRVRALDPTDGGTTPAVALTAYGRPEDRIRTLSAGFSMHVPKPVDPAELTTIIASVVTRFERA